MPFTFSLEDFGECLLPATKEFCEGLGIDFQAGNASAPYTWDRDISMID